MVYKSLFLLDADVVKIWRLDFFDSLSRRLKVFSEIYEIYYLFSRVRRVLSRISHFMVFLGSISEGNRLVKDP